MYFLVFSRRFELYVYMLYCLGGTIALHTNSDRITMSAAVHHQKATSLYRAKQAPNKNTSLILILLYNYHL